MLQAALQARRSFLTHIENPIGLPEQ